MAPVRVIMQSRRSASATNDAEQLQRPPTSAVTICTSLYDNALCCSPVTREVWLL